MDDRKYRPSGSRSDSSQPQARRDLPRPSSPPAVFKSRPISRCAECGVVLPIVADSLAQCPNCRTELHTCRHCAHFDPAQRFECAQPIAERIVDKRARNECARFSLMVTVERDTSSGAVRPDAARRSFGNLFKK
jgi:hypothetical protein